MIMLIVEVIVITIMVAKVATCGLPWTTSKTTMSYLRATILSPQVLPVKTHSTAYTRSLSRSNTKSISIRLNIDIDIAYFKMLKI